MNMETTNEIDLISIGAAATAATPDATALSQTGRSLASGRVITPSLRAFDFDELTEYQIPSFKHTKDTSLGVVRNGRAGRRL